MNLLSNDTGVELAILQEDISSSNPSYADFTIPILVDKSQTGIQNINKYNIANKKINSGFSTTVNTGNTIRLKVPKEYTFFYGADIVPKGTRFIIAFIGGNINDIRIIGRYDDKEE